MSVERVDDGEAIVTAPTRFLRDWVAAHYADRLLALWRAENQRVTSVSIVVAVAHRRNGLDHSAARGTQSENRGGPAPPFAEPAAVLEISEDKAQFSPLDQRFTFENFVVGKPNELAHAAARRVAEACANSVHTVPFNPLFLYGGVGLGKTHLMHAVAWHVRRHACDRKVIYLSAEKFMYQFIRALRFKSTMDFK